MSFPAYRAHGRRVRGGLCAVVVLAALVAGCREQGDIQVKSLTFDGVERVDEGAL